MTSLINKESANGYATVPVEAELLNSREIFLTEPVDPETMNALIMSLLYLERKSPDEEITLYINSPGGDVSSGLAAYDLMKLMRAPIRTVCIGTAASMAAILFLAGEKREMLPNTNVMIHDPSIASFSVQYMKPAEVGERLTGLKKTQASLCRIISQVTGRPEKEVRKKMRTDSFFSAEEAVEFGLATAVCEKL